MTDEALAEFRATLPQQLRVLIATPCDDGHRLCFWRSLRALEHAQDPAGHTYATHTPPGDSLVPRARNNINHDFYFKTDFDYLGFLDSDLDFRPEDVWQLMAHRLPIVAGMYAIKQTELRWCINILPGENADPVTGLRKVACAGTGALFYHRSVIKAMIDAAPSWPHWKCRYLCDHTKEEKFHLFSHVVIDDPVEFGEKNNPRDMSEDWSFCFFARKLGFDVMLDTRAIFWHEGSAMYPLGMRRLTKEEVDAGMIKQDDGTHTHIQPGVPV